MSPNTILINDLLEALDEEDYRLAITFLQYLADMKKKKRLEESKQILSQIQGMFSSDRYWESEDAMIADMAAFRRERMGL